MIELRSSTGELDFSRVTDEIIQALDEPRRLALLNLMKASDAVEACISRRNAATKRVFDAIADEAIKQQVHADASSPIPFVAPKPEDFGTTAAFNSAMQEARTQHAARVRGHLEDEARQRSRESYIANH